MRRDWNLIRLLLLEIESESPPNGLDAYSKEQQLYHAVLLVESELVHGEIVVNENGTPTWTNARMQSG